MSTTYKPGHVMTENDVEYIAKLEALWDKALAAQEGAMRNHGHEADEEISQAMIECNKAHQKVRQ